MADEQPKVNGTVLEVPYPVPADPVADDHLEAVKVSQPANGFNVDVPDDNKVKPIPATGLSFTLDKTTVGVGETNYANVNFAPDYAGDKALTWTSSDTTIATVNRDGMITGKKDGDITLTAKTSDGKISATTDVKVGKGTQEVKVTGVTIAPKTMTLTVGGATRTATATISPADATNKAVTWESSDTAIITVDANGKVTPVAEGTATLTVKTVDGGKTDTCAVTVNPAA